MLYAYRIEPNGYVTIMYCGGLFSGELQRLKDAGFKTYWTTDRNAGRDGLLLAKTDILEGELNRENLYI